MIASMSVHTVTIKRLPTDGDGNPTQNATGGFDNNGHTSAARGSLAKTAKCRAIIMSPKEKLDHGVRAEQDGWKFLFPADPSITLLDRIEFKFTPNEATRTVKVLTASHARSANERFYKVMGVVDGTEVSQ